MTTILITGAAGTIGREVVQFLYGRYSLVLVDKDLSSLTSLYTDKVTLKEIDLTQPSSFEGLLENVDYIIHLAGNPDWQADYEDLIEMNYHMPYYLFEQAKEYGRLKRLIFASSIHTVEGYSKDRQLQESDAIRPDGHYGVSKLYLESLANLYAFQYGVPSVGIRIADYKASHERLSEKTDDYGRAQFLSAYDFNQLLEQILTSDRVSPYLIINAVSDNRFKRLSIDCAKQQLGYRPIDDGFEL